jgi:hypothetical protein
LVTPLPEAMRVPTYFRIHMLVCMHSSTVFIKQSEQLTDCARAGSGDGVEWRGVERSGAEWSGVD